MVISGDGQREKLSSLTAVIITSESIEFFLSYAPRVRAVVKMLSISRGFPLLDPIRAAMASGVTIDTNF